MSDTIAASIDVASLRDSTLEFIVGQTPQAAPGGALHVGGAANAPGAPSLTIDFVTYGAAVAAPSTMPDPLPPTVSGGAFLQSPQDFSPVIPGGLHPM